MAHLLGGTWRLWLYGIRKTNLDLFPLESWEKSTLPCMVLESKGFFSPPVPLGSLIFCTVFLWQVIHFWKTYFNPAAATNMYFESKKKQVITVGILWDFRSDGCSLSLWGKCRHFNLTFMERLNGCRLRMVCMVKCLNLNPCKTHSTVLQHCLWMIETRLLCSNLSCSICIQLCLKKDM